MRFASVRSLPCVLAVVLAKFAKRCCDADCLVGDIMYREGDSVGQIGLECVDGTNYDGLASTCGKGGEIVDEERSFSCSGSVPHCVQCGPRGWGNALCLSKPDPGDRDCGDDPNKPVCPNGQKPVPGTFCGRGPDRADCGKNEFCHIHPADKFAVCCPKAEPKCCDPEKGPGGCPDAKGSFDRCWDEGGFCCSDGKWYPNDGAGGNNCKENQLQDSQPCDVGCLVGDIMHAKGDSMGHIGLECVDGEMYDGLESTCGPGATVMEEELSFKCPANVPHCVQCGPRGRGNALCLSTPTTNSDCGKEKLRKQQKGVKMMATFCGCSGDSLRAASVNSAKKRILKQVVRGSVLRGIKSCQEFLSANRIKLRKFRVQVVNDSPPSKGRCLILSFKPIVVFSEPVSHEGLNACVGRGLKLEDDSFFVQKTINHPKLKDIHSCGSIDTHTGAQRPIGHWEQA